MLLRSDAVEKKAKKEFDQLNDVIALSRSLPTIQLFDAVWQVTFHWLRAVCPRAEKYLQEQYFQYTATENIQRQFRCSTTLWGAKSIWFAGFWSGIIGTYPGSSSGTQTLESFHAYWQTRLEAQARAKPTEVLACMQDIYRNDWCQKFCWSEQRSFMTWPERSAEALFNSDSLRSSGRSPAVDFWQERGKRLCGQTNYFQAYIRTDGQKNSVDPSGITTFWILRSAKLNGVMPADAVISKEFGTAFANLIATEGDELASWLAKSGIIKHEETKRDLNIDALRTYFGFHCAVMVGHLPNSSWPRQRRKTELRIPSMVCTCVEFLMHAECEHIVYVQALTDETRARELQQVPVLRKKGRKRKGDATDRVGGDKQQDNAKKRKAASCLHCAEG